MDIQLFVLCTFCITQCSGFFFFSAPVEGPSQITMAGQGGGSSPPLTTHILDTARGQPAQGVAMTLSKLDQSGQWQLVETGVTNTDGRGGFFGSSEKWTDGTYKLYFDTGAYFASLHTKGFYPYVEVVFHIDDPGQHYHVPLLLSPYSYSTYRGS